MKVFKGLGTGVLLFIAPVTALTACSERVRPAASAKSGSEGDIGGPGSNALGCSRVPGLQDNERLITILGTNDIHGAVDAKTVGSGDNRKTVGGMPFWAGVVSSIRSGLDEKTGSECGGVLLVDGGDQFQGTLLSNYSEGELMFDLMNEAGYDAVVPGNHDYDFGPLGWLEDQVSERVPESDRDPRGVIKKLAAQAKFSLISANTYYTASIERIDQPNAPIAANGCKSDSILGFATARRPEFLKSHVIVERAGLKIALVGLDNPETASMTTAANVSDLCFRDPAEEYIEIRKSLEGQADLFVIVMHNGDVSGDQKMTAIVKKILEADPRGVDAVVGGHTHNVNLVNVDGVPAIQSGANGERFGRIQLVYNVDTKQVDRAKTQFFAGVQLDNGGCENQASSFCSVSTDADTGATVVSYDAKPVTLDPEAARLVDDAKARLAPMASRLLGEAKKKLYRDRILESPLANVLTDELRAVSGADIATVNTGGIRTDIQVGPVTYETLFSVLPFANRAVVIGPLSTQTLVRLVTRSVVTCGSYGSLMFSGIRVTYSRDCRTPVDGLDPQAKLLTIALAPVNGVDGEIIYDNRGPVPVIQERDFMVATLDFLAAGGSGYESFIGTPLIRDLGIFREVLADKLVTQPAAWNSELDSRWKNVFQAPAPNPAE